MVQDQLQKALQMPMISEANGMGEHRGAEQIDVKRLPHCHWSSTRL
ncbi:MAG TPA: hypothetical protein VHS80_11090 [Chthoniobacterales bacterium]|nr:hypothetical protein [Chthoniobacterales bacterium]